MVKVPIGKVVKVDLWDSKKRRGMVKYNTNTMDLVRAESEFDLKKGDLAIIVESHDSFALIVPKDDYTDLIKGKSLNSIDYQGLTHLIYIILRERIEETGGILTFEELYSILKRTSIRKFLKKKDLLKALNFKEAEFDRIKEGGKIFAVLKPSDCSNDEITILNLAKNHPYLTIDLIQNAMKWSSLRIKRILEYLIKQKRCRKDSSYLSGERYYFQGI